MNQLKTRIPLYHLRFTASGQELHKIQTPPGFPDNRAIKLPIIRRKSGTKGIRRMLAQAIVEIGGLDLGSSKNSELLFCNHL